MKVRYTGAGPDALMLCKDKALAKKLLSYHRVRVARFVVSPRDRPLKRLERFVYPAFVKPVGEESSDGIAQASLARDEDEAIERARFLHERFERRRADRGVRRRARALRGRAWATSG